MGLFFFGHYRRTVAFLSFPKKSCCASKEETKRGAEQEIMEKNKKKKLTKSSIMTRGGGNSEERWGLEVVGFVLHFFSLLSCSIQWVGLFSSIFVPFKPK
eukprot:TRINITY_DN1132_c0_g1_i1.p1 TRINITY_DN1132_c0_g1~~TRINITY_DN1132_c0_g1_i1.p1  ORF type:complete len:115 (-),score=5.83 TRINITY_DN1132_c0_g1_i1:1107-1406(-)